MGILMSKNCLECNRKFSKRLTDSTKYFLAKRKYCSYGCFTKVWQRTTLKDKIKTRDSRETISCLICKKDFKDYISNKRVVCSNECRALWISENKSGKNAANWQGGITPQINERCNSDWWKVLRMKVYIRDNFECQICGITCTKRIDNTQIQCDHIIKESDGGIHDMSNLWTLCKGCHTRKDRNYLNRRIFLT